LTARQLAVSALLKCRKSGAWSGNVLDSLIKREKLDERDKNLAFNICMGVIQNGMLIDYYLNRFCQKPVEQLDSNVAEILRSGIYQLVFLDKIPASAAVNESVELCSFFGCTKAKSFVNAVLRKASAQNELPKIENIGTAGYLSIKYSHPVWLAELLISSKGYSFTESFFEENNKKAPVDLKINTLKTDISSYKHMLDDCGIQYFVPDFPPNCITLDGGNVTALPGYNDGLFYVQDRAAAAVSEIADIYEGMNILDCCSAPGGKSFSTALKMNNKGSIISCDIHEKKLGLISSGASRLGIDIISVKHMDASKPNSEYNNRFDIVIADVPCSGIGVIRKKPEIRYKSCEEISRLPEIQFGILENVSKYVKPAGELIYSTCTVIQRENEDVIHSFLKDHPDFTLTGFTCGDTVCEDGMLTFWPNIHGTDGFFVAKLKRIR